MKTTSAQGPNSAADAKGVAEGTIIFLVAAIQFVNVLDFMLAVPLGPFFARGLGIPTSQLGLVTGSYAAAAALTGFFGAGVLDRFERKRALTVAVAGLIVGTAAGAAARDLTTMILARFLAGAFAGPATSLALSIVADVVPPQRRGQAMSKVMGAFAIASSLGVPLGLHLALVASWRAPFLAVAALGAPILALAASRLPTLRGHLVNAPTTTPFERMRELAIDRTVQLALLTNVFVFVAAFLVIPNIAAHLMQNLGYPAERLKWAYVVGGVSSIFVLALTGRAVDKRGPTFVASWGTVIFWVALVLGFIAPDRFFHLPTFALFAIFMGGMSMRNISLGSLATRVPRPQERAAFMSLQSVAQQFSMGLGSFVSTALLHDTPDGKLAGVAVVSTLALAFAAALPPLLVVITRRVRAREAIAAAVAAPAVTPPAAIAHG